MKDIKETIIKLNDTGITEVTTLYNDNSRVVKNILFSDLAPVLLSSVEKDNEKKALDSNILPNNDALGVSTVRYRKNSNDTEEYFLLLKRTRCDIKYHSDLFKDVGIPNLIFMIKIFEGQLRTMRVCAVKETRITNNTQIYHYPFSNVGSDGSVCFGRNAIYEFRYDNIENLFSVPFIFLSMPNNDDMYGDNLSDLKYRELLTLLENEDFDDEFLKERKRTTFGNWSSL